jgi:hypothetical protein
MTGGLHKSDNLNRSERMNWIREIFWNGPKHAGETVGTTLLTEKKERRHIRRQLNKGNAAELDLAGLMA